MDRNSLHKRKPISNIEWQLHFLRNKLIDTVNVHLHCTKAMSFSDNYHPQTKFGAPVCHSVHRGEYLGRYIARAGTPLGMYSPRAGTPPWAATPLGSYTPGQLHPQQCMLGYGQQAGGTHPTGMHSCSTRQLHWLTVKMKEIFRFRICLRLV